MAEEPAHAPYELLKFPGITAIGENHQQGHEAVAEEAQEQPGPINKPCSVHLASASCTVLLGANSLSSSDSGSLS
ncbi:MAG: hypothetical protein JWO94_913 [Verrucomicrobiaceae bacterium]|nr:hypothetical protein [Verrucomicrobiaceae bacterium]